MQRIVQVRHRVVGAVDGQRVLDQVVGADRQEIELAQERASASAAAGISIMPPTCDVRVERHALLAQLSLACAIIASVWSISRRDASIGIRMRTLP